MTKVSMEPIKLKEDSNEWIELETETINIVSNINSCLEQISNEALKTPMLKKEFDNLVDIYKQIENSLTKNLSLINSFFEEQFKKYDNLGNESAESAGMITDGTNHLANETYNPVETRNTADNDLNILGKNDIKVPFLALAGIKYPFIYYHTLFL